MLKKIFLKIFFKKMAKKTQWSRVGIREAQLFRSLLSACRLEFASVSKWAWTSGSESLEIHYVGLDGPAAEQDSERDAQGTVGQTKWDPNRRGLEIDPGLLSHQ